MNLTINVLRPGLYTLAVSLDYDYATVINALEAEDWQTHGDRKNSAGLAGNPYVERAGLLNPKSQVLKDIMAFVNSDAVKEQLVNVVYETQYM